MPERIFRTRPAILTLRDRPSTTATVLTRLQAGQLVARLDEQDLDGWWWVFADVPGDGGFVGYVASQFVGPWQDTPVLSGPFESPNPAIAGATPFVERLVAFCAAERERFRFGALKEHVEPARSRIAEYWRHLGIMDRDGSSDFAWSAAFISFAMAQAGAGNRFKRGGGHVIYINDAIRNRDNPAAFFQGLRVDEYAPRLGDLIARDRPDGEQPPITYDNATSLNWYKSHTDIVTKIEPRRVVMVGGNLSQSVGQRTLALAPDGTIDRAAGRTARVFAILKNNIAD